MGHAPSPFGRERFIAALAFAARVHAEQRRKGVDTPYIAHPLIVAGTVIENGGDEDEAIAALLHDAVEDQGGDEMGAEIARRFGPRVAEIVLGCSDCAVVPKPPWRPRKEKAVAEVREGKLDRSVLLVELADKLHNARAILQDYRVSGEKLWDRFTGGRDGTLWYYRALADAFRKAFDHPLAAELDRTVAELERLAEKRLEA